MLYQLLGLNVSWNILITTSSLYLSVRYVAMNGWMAAVERKLVLVLLFPATIRRDLYMPLPLNATVILTFV
jgi:hypothetical protein